VGSGRIILIDRLGRRNVYVEKLVVFAGPSGIGKTFMVERLGHAPFAELSKQLGITEPGLWDDAWGKELHETPDLEVERLIFPYDLARLWKRKYRSGYSEDPLLKVLSTSKEITVATLWARPEIILERFLERQRRKAHDTRHKSRAIMRMLYRRAFPREVTKLYRNPADLPFLYREWIRFCRDFSLEAHWLVDATSDSLAYCPLDENSFRAMIESLTGQTDEP
jgi:hypothetical protein